MTRPANIVTATLLSLLLAGCAADQAALDAATAGKTGVATAAGSLASAQTYKGAAMAHTAALPGLLNPAVILSSGAAMAQSAANARRNEAAAAKLARIVADEGKMERGMNNMLVVAYNREYGTHFKTYDELQDHLWVEGYNKKYGTRFRTLSQIRRDYNRRKGTHYQSDEAFRRAIRDGKLSE